jgi:large-conductance mechanosensitive channel
MKDNFTISVKDVEQLQLDLFLQYVIIYLLIILLVFLIMKKISEHDIKLEFLKNKPLLQGLLLLKLFK